MAYWDVSTSVYSGKSFFVGDQSLTCTSIRFKPDGFIMYIVDRIYNIIFQYTLSIAWDITTAIYSGNFLDVGKQDVSPRDISFNPDGSIMCMLGYDNDTVFQYDLGVKKRTPWDVSSAVYRRIRLDVSAQSIHLGGSSYSSDGTKFYILDTLNSIVYQYNLSVPWDISSGLYSGISFYLGGEHTYSKNITFSPDGIHLYSVNTVYDSVFQYTLSIPWDLSTASYSNKFFYVGYQATFATGISFNLIGSEMYITCSTTDKVYQYDLPEIPPPPPKKEASRTGIYSFKTL